MADENAPTVEPEDAPAPAGDAAAEPLPDPAAEVQALKDQLAAANDRMLRMAAEMDNLRKRTQREVEDARQYSIAGFARDVLTIGDNLVRTLGAVPAEARAAGEAGLTTLIEGVELTERELQKTLAKHKVTRLEPKGQKFDPNLHQAMFEVPRDDLPSGTVAEVVQDGYVIGERVLRPAMVGVVKNAGPAAPAAAANEDQPEE